MAKWYYSSDGIKQEGPVSKSQVLKLYKQNPDLLVWYKGLPRWKKGHEVFGLSPVLKSLFFLGIIGIFAVSGYYLFQYFKPITLPKEFMGFQKDYETVRKIDLKERIAFDIKLDPNFGLLLLTNLPDETQFSVKFLKTNKTHSISVINNFGWKKNVNFPKGPFDLEITSQELPNLKNTPGISIHKGKFLFSRTMRLELFPDPTWPKYLQHVQTFKSILKDFRIGYEDLLKQPNLKLKKQFWTKWAPEWSKFYTAWFKSAVQSKSEDMDPSRYNFIIKLGEEQAKLFDEMASIGLKDSKVHGKFKARLSKLEANSKKIRITQ